MIDNETLNAWFCREVLPLERALTAFIRRNWRVADDVVDIRQEIYERVLNSASSGLPTNAPSFVYTLARNHLINSAKRARIVSFDLVADLESVDREVDMLAADRHLTARDELRRAQEGLARLSPRCREVVQLRKLEGLSTREAAEKLGVGIDAVERQLVMGMRALVDFMAGGSGKIIWQNRQRPRKRRDES
jgi:RNA polymerase sigma factor (sigma-70 family)